MTSKVQFRVGDFECIAIKDGTFPYPTEWFFSNVPRAQLEDYDLGLSHIVGSYTCLLVKTGKHMLLVDTGGGVAVNEYLKKDRLAPTSGDLLKHLSADGIAREEITNVVLTHAHPDHIGGVVDASGKPAFANAKYTMSKTEWDFWTSNPDLDNLRLDDQIKEFLVTSAQKNLPPLKGGIELFEGETEVVPGVHVIPAPGHTPGHIALVISSANEELLHVADAVLHPMHLEHPRWRNAFDLNQDYAAITRRRLLDRAAADNAIVLAYHFPFPGIGRVKKSANAWKWESLKGINSRQCSYDRQMES